MFARFSIVWTINLVYIRWILCTWNSMVRVSMLLYVTVANYNYVIYKRI